MCGVSWFLSKRIEKYTYSGILIIYFGSDASLFTRHRLIYHKYLKEKFDVYFSDEKYEAECKICGTYVSVAHKRAGYLDHILAHTCAGYLDHILAHTCAGYLDHILANKLQVI